jgi:hypothetical protein
MSEERAEGFYWVIAYPSDTPQPAEWVGGAWMITGHDDPLADENMDYISSTPMIPPNIRVERDRRGVAIAVKRA